MRKLGWMGSSGNEGKNIIDTTKMRKARKLETEQKYRFPIVLILKYLFSSTTEAPQQQHDVHDAPALSYSGEC